MMTFVEKQESQKKSDGLTRIVAVVYGIALTQALTKNQDVILHPLTQTNKVAALALAAASIVSGYGFFSYTLAVDGPYKYDVGWAGSSTGGFLPQTKIRSAIRFAFDLLVAGLYVRFLLSAAALGTSPSDNPNLRGLLVSLSVVMAGVIVSRFIRYVLMNLCRLRQATVRYAFFLFLPPLLLGGAAGWTALKYASSHRLHGSDDQKVLWVLVVLVILYTLVSHSLSYLFWENVTRPSPGRVRSRQLVAEWEDGTVKAVRVIVEPRKDLLVGIWDAGEATSIREVLAKVLAELEAISNSTADKGYTVRWTTEETTTIQASLQALVAGLNTQLT